VTNKQVVKYAKARLLDLIDTALPMLSPAAEWPYKSKRWDDYHVAQTQHWFYCLVAVLGIQRESLEDLRHFMGRIRKELRP
jgi:hypothetical protein